MEQEKLYDWAANISEAYVNSQIHKFCRQATQKGTDLEYIECTNRNRHLNSEYFLRFTTNQEEKEK